MGLARRARYVTSCNEFLPFPRRRRTTHDPESFCLRGRRERSPRFFSCKTISQVPFPRLFGPLQGAYRRDTRVFSPVPLVVNAYPPSSYSPLTRRFFSASVLLRFVLQAICPFEKSD